MRDYMSRQWHSQVSTNYRYIAVLCGGLTWESSNQSKSRQRVCPSLQYSLKQKVHLNHDVPWEIFIVKTTLVSRRGCAHISAVINHVAVLICDVI